MFLEITNEQINEAINKLIDGSINLGGKILGALIIFIIGKFIVNWINKLFAAMLQKRKVDASIQSFLKSIVNITVRVWVNAADYWGVNFDMNKNVYATFNEKGISFPFPQLTVHQA